MTQPIVTKDMIIVALDAYYACACQYAERDAMAEALQAAIAAMPPI